MSACPSVGWFWRFAATTEHYSKPENVVKREVSGLKMPLWAVLKYRDPRGKLTRNPVALLLSDCFSVMSLFEAVTLRKYVRALTENYIHLNKLAFSMNTENLICRFKDPGPTLGSCYSLNFTSILSWLVVSTIACWEWARASHLQYKHSITETLAFHFYF